MNDAENLSKLLGHLPPAVFQSFMAAKFSLEMPDLDKKATKKDQRAGMEAGQRNFFSVKIPRRFHREGSLSLSG